MTFIAYCQTLHCILHRVPAGRISQENRFITFVHTGILLYDTKAGTTQTELKRADNLSISDGGMNESLI